MKKTLLFLIVFFGFGQVWASNVTPAQCNRASVEAFQKLKILEQAMMKTGLKCKHSFEAFGCQKSIENSKKIQSDYISTLSDFNMSCKISSPAAKNQ